MVHDTRPDAESLILLPFYFMFDNPDLLRKAGPRTTCHFTVYFAWYLFN